jgi:hypothetical protein
MTEYMTMAEIEAKFPNEWVFLANPTTTRYHEVTGGQVILHAADRAEYLRMVGEWEGDANVRRFASWYMGESGNGVGELLPADAGPEPGAA